MGKFVRSLCLFTPALLSIASAAIVLVILLGGISKNNRGLDQLYEYRIDFTQFKKSVDAKEYMKPAGSLVDNLLYALRTSAQNGKLKDFYQIYLWNYCEGNGKDIDFCSPRQMSYFFNPVAAWSLDTTLSSRYTPNNVAEPLSVFQKGVKWLFAAYVVALVSNLLSVIVGLLAICTRLGSIFATIMSTIAAVFSFLAALTSMLLFKALIRAWSSALQPYTITVTRGSTLLALDWTAFVLSAGAAAFYLFSICCVAPKSKKTSAAKEGKAYRGLGGLGGSGGYKQIDDQEKSLMPNNEGSNVPLHQQDTSYTGGYDIAPDNVPQYTAGKGPYAARDSKYEPYRSVDA